MLNIKLQQSRHCQMEGANDRTSYVNNKRMYKFGDEDT